MAQKFGGKALSTQKLLIGRTLKDENTGVLWLKVSFKADKKQNKVSCLPLSIFSESNATKKIAELFPITCSYKSQTDYCDIERCNQTGSYGGNWVWLLLKIDVTTNLLHVPLLWNSKQDASLMIAVAQPLLQIIKNWLGVWKMLSSGLQFKSWVWKSPNYITVTFFGKIGLSSIHRKTQKRLWR